ncbi:MAG: Wzz/FepE/Etk N-terminal domain-containing protein [Anaerococcus sp.]|uniref:YveK family protein n=1 Tax=Anaerococcus sp. TaxID=1872515 RepID=UPI0028FFCEAC|nr:Wzz/FepE/Etk N-terminal domain-containing protein [Anaerococcus sp.]MDU2354715.1 Wzz/FepE/Etk N-terminal domain-containing protein [Anaerococcus sp.]
MNEQEIDLIELFNNIKKHTLLIIILGLLIGGISYGISSYLLTPKYDSNATMIVSNSTSTDSQNPDQTNVELGQIQANKALISTYSEIVKSRGIADKVISNLNLDMSYESFSQKVSIEPVNDTQIISVKVVDTIPERAKDIANETANIFKDSIGDIMKVDNVQILDGATLPEGPSSPNIKKNTSIGIVLGLVLGVLIAIFKELSDKTIKSQEQVMEYFDIPVIGVIPDKKQG